MLTFTNTLTMKETMAIVYKIFAEKLLQGDKHFYEEQFFFCNLS